MMDKEMLSQEEIDLLLKGTNDDETYNVNRDSISELEKDAIGEIGNISMGTAATTLSTLLNKKVTITTPKVMITTTSELANEFPIPFVAVDVKYKKGLEGSNVLIIKESDAKVITDIMMGNEINEDRELTELDLSAVSEVMNQMMGSAATSLSEMFSKRIDIEPPKAFNITFEEGKDKLDVLKTDDPIIRVSFRMLVENLIDSTIMQLIPIDFGLEMVESLMNTSSYSIESSEGNIPLESTEDLYGSIPIDESNNSKTTSDNQQRNLSQENHVVVKKPVFESFDSNKKTTHKESIDLVGDIPIELTVELGRTVKKIGEILEYGPGTVIELDKLVGEPLNVYANGKFIARGEVVVIDDNFGIRITDIENTYEKK